MSQDKNTLLKVITSRFRHPFVGSFIIAFLIQNYDALILLFYGINNGYPEIAIADFQENFSEPFKNERITYPLFFMAIYPNFLPWVDIGYAFLISYAESVKRNAIAWAKSFDNKYRMNFLENQVSNQKSEIKRLEDFIQLMRDLIHEDYSFSKTYFLVRLDTSCKELDLVSINLEYKMATRLNSKNKNYCIGLLLKKIRPDLGLVKEEPINNFDGLNFENLSLEQGKIYWDHKKKEYSTDFTESSTELATFRRKGPGDYTVETSARPALGKKDKDDLFAEVLKDFNYF